MVKSRKFMSAKIFIREIHVKLIAIAMGIIGVSILSITPFLNKVKPHPVPVAAQMSQLCSVDTAEAEWKYIVLHHSATQEGNAANFNAYHKNKRKWKYGLAYHFVIGNGSHSDDGEIEVGPRWKRQIHGAHAATIEFNKVAIGICLVGNFEKQNGPTERQLEALLNLVVYLCKRYAIPADRVIGHNEVQRNHTVCPGKYFPLDEFKMKLRDQIWPSAAFKEL